MKAAALAHAIPVYQPDRLRAADVESTIRAWRPDLGVVAAYGKIIPESLLAVPRHGMINVHASLLPRFRGAAPVHRAVIAGDTETGVTIMRVEKALDSGGMFAKATRPTPSRGNERRRRARPGGAGLRSLLVSVVYQSQAALPPKNPRTTIERPTPLD